MFFNFKKNIAMIERIVIDNFKSIGHADVKLQKVNLFIGPNNSGKSNFLKCIDYINKKGNKFNGDLNSIHFVGLNKENKPTEIQIQTAEGKILLSGSSDDHLESLSMEDFRYKQRFFLGGFASEIYKINPEKLKKLYMVGKPTNYLFMDGSNISFLLQNYLNKHREIFNKICAQLFELTGYFNDVLIDLVNDDGSPLKEEGFGRNVHSKFGLVATDGKEFWAEELSEGVLYLLALLCIVHQPTPPHLLLIEEPETGIHPRRLKEVIDLIRKLSTEKDIQVIVTTHSPLVVDLFEDEPESIHIFEMKEGFTEIKNLKTDIIDPANKELESKGIDATKDYGVSLGDQWVYGLLGGVPA